jgi:hypothetical protein
MEVVGLRCSLSTGLRCSWGAEAKETNWNTRCVAPPPPEQGSRIQGWTNTRTEQVWLTRQRFSSRGGPSEFLCGTLAPNRINPNLLKQYTAMLTWTHHTSVLRLSWDSRPNKLLTHSWSWALLEKPPIEQLLENFPAFYGTRRFITAIT